MKPETLKLIIQAFNCASDDATRLALQHVCLEPGKDNEVSIVSTSGHHLSKAKVNDEELFKALDGKRWLVDIDLLPILKAIGKCWNKILTIPMEVKHGEIVLSAPGFSASIKPESDIKFPNYEQVIPKDKHDYTVVIGVNPEYIMDIFKSLNIEKRRMGIKLEINPNDKHAPIIVEHGEGFGLVMPMRL